MKPASILLLAAALLVGCDQGGSPPTGAPGTGTSGGGTSGGGGGTKDTTTTGLVVYDSTKLLGPVTLTGGTVREALLYLAQDRSLHIIASSDGANGQSTVGRETDWDVQITTADSISGSWVTALTERGKYDVITPSNSPHALRITVHCVANAMETRIAASSGALLTVSVQAHSGVDDRTAGWTPPLLADDTTAKLVRLGTNQTSVSKATFAVRMPTY